MGRQNVYDDERFFESYQAMRDAQGGINEAVEQPAVRAMLPSVVDAVVVDLGCGDGQLSRELASAGARSVVGVDPSTQMLALARDRTNDPRVRYVQAFAEDATFPTASADLVVSSLALHYVADLGSLLARVADWLTPGGYFVASMEHPIRTAAPGKRADGLYVVDDYADEGVRNTTWYVEGVLKYHRRLETIVNGLIAAGLELRQLAEPVPTPDALAARPDLADHVRRPAILVVSATRRPAQARAAETGARTAAQPGGGR